MTNSASTPPVDLKYRLAEVCAAYLAEPVVAGVDQPVPPLAESREMLRLFVRIGNDELRRSILRLLRAMVDDRPAGHI